MNEAVRDIQKEVIKRYANMHVGSKIIENPELESATDAPQLYAALSTVLWRCPVHMPPRQKLLCFRRDVRIKGNLSFDGKLEN